MPRGARWARRWRDVTVRECRRTTSRAARGRWRGLCGGLSSLGSDQSGRSKGGVGGGRVRTRPDAPAWRAGSGRAPGLRSCTVVHASWRLRRDLAPWAFVFDMHRRIGGLPPCVREQRDSISGCRRASLGRGGMGGQVVVAKSAKRASESQTPTTTHAVEACGAFYRCGVRIALSSSRSGPVIALVLALAKTNHRI